MIKYYIIIILILFFSCSYLTKGHIESKYIEKCYYEIQIDDDEKAIYKNRTVIRHDKDGNSYWQNERYFSHYDYIGTTFKEVLFEELYIIKVSGFNKKEKKITLEFIISKNYYNLLKTNDFIKLKNKDSFWENYLYELKNDYWRSQKEINKIYIKGDNKNYNIQQFENNYKNDWILKRDYKWE